MLCIQGIQGRKFFANDWGRIHFFGSFSLVQLRRSGLFIALDDLMFILFVFRRRGVAHLVRSGSPCRAAEKQKEIQGGSASINRPLLRSYHTTPKKVECAQKSHCG
jgi:hypothetical protein